MAEYSYKYHKSSKINTKYVKIGLIVFSSIVIVLFAFLLKTYNQRITPFDYPVGIQFPTDQISVRLLGLSESGMVLGTECQQLLIPITNDQLFSISNGITKDFSRPLTHDIYKTTLEHFEITPIRFSIDRWENELWYATLRLQKGFDVLDMDIRPSDGVAIAVRYNLSIFIDKEIFDEKARLIC